MSCLEMNAVFDTERDSMATMILNPFLVKTFVLMMSSQFNTRAAQHIEGTIQFYFAGEVDGSCFCIIEDGIVEPNMGVAEKADLILGGPYSLWRDILSGEADVYQMLIKGRIQALGDMSLMQIFVRQD